MKTPQWKFIRRFKRGNGIQTSIYEEICCMGCEKKCQHLVNLTDDELRPASCPKGD